MSLGLFRFLVHNQKILMKLKTVEVIGEGLGDAKMTEVNGEIVVDEIEGDILYINIIMEDLLLQLQKRNEDYLSLQTRYQALK